MSCANTTTDINNTVTKMRLKNICWWRRIYFKQHLKSHIFHFLESKLTVHRHIRASQAFVWSFQPLSDVSAALSLRLWFYWYLLFSICSVETCAWVSHSNSCFPSESFMKPTEPHEKNNKSDQSLLILHKKKGFCCGDDSRVPQVTDYFKYIALCLFISYRLYNA